MQRLHNYIRQIVLLLLLWGGGTVALYAQVVDEEEPDTASTIQRRHRRVAVGRVREQQISLQRPAEVADTAVVAPTPTTVAGDTTIVDTLTISIGEKGLEPISPGAMDSLRILHMTDSIQREAESWFARKKRFKPDPIRAMWLGLVIPGAGQVYNRKYWKLPIIYGGFLGCTYALTWNSQMLSDYQQAYLDIMDDDPFTCSYLKMLPMGYDISGREERFKQIFKNKKDYFRKYRDLSIFAFIGVYLLSVVDAYVDAELSTFDISRDLSIQWEPTFIETDYTSTSHYRRIPAVQCRLRF